MAGMAKWISLFPHPFFEFMVEKTQANIIKYCRITLLVGLMSILSSLGFNFIELKTFRIPIYAYIYSVFRLLKWNCLKHLQEEQFPKSCFK